MCPPTRARHDESPMSIILSHTSGNHVSPESHSTKLPDTHRGGCLPSSGRKSIWESDLWYRWRQPHGQRFWLPPLCSENRVDQRELTFTICPAGAQETYGNIGQTKP